ncbi:hypothetical protein CSUI_002908 [Cystoisospora suis]|uniref:Uncharacterized protein n=1 Tax=Cystoisospora suis TaxID=483139 RepID=A0A2C6L7E9_9APIC|nr:hypothetical protein CSUI_002908 [Cystoisospora suis]
MFLGRRYAFYPRRKLTTGRVWRTMAVIVRGRWCRDLYCSGIAGDLQIAANPPKPDLNAMSVTGRGVDLLSSLGARLCKPRQEPQQSHAFRLPKSCDLGAGASILVFERRNLLYSEPERLLLDIPSPRPLFAAKRTQPKPFNPFTWKEKVAPCRRASSSPRTCFAGTAARDPPFPFLLLRKSSSRRSQFAAGGRFFGCPVVPGGAPTVDPGGLPSFGLPLFSCHARVLQKECLPLCFCTRNDRSATALCDSSVRLAQREFQGGGGPYFRVSRAQSLRPPGRGKFDGVSVLVLRQEAKDLLRQMQDTVEFSPDHSQSTLSNEVDSPSQAHNEISTILEASGIVRDVGVSVARSHQEIPSQTLTSSTCLRSQKGQPLGSRGEVDAAGSIMLLSDRLHGGFYRQHERRLMVHIARPLVQGSGRIASKFPADPRNAIQRAEGRGLRESPCQHNAKDNVGDKSSRIFSRRYACVERNEEGGSESQAPPRWDHDTARGTKDTWEKEAMAAAWRRVEKAVRAVEALQPKMASAAEIAEVARLCREASAAVRGTSKASEDFMRPHAKEAIGVPLRVQVTLLKKMTAVPGWCLPRNECHVKSFFESLHRGLLDAVGNLQLQLQLLSAQTQKLQGQPEDADALSFSTDMNSNASSSEEFLVKTELRKAAQKTLWQLRESCVAMRNHIVTCMWAFCVLGIRARLQITVPVFAKLVQVQKELRNEAAKTGLREATDAAGAVFARGLFKRLFNQEDIECLVAVLGYTRRARLPGQVQSLVRLLTQDDAELCLADLSADDLCQIQYELQQSLGEWNTASGAVREDQTVLIQTLVRKTTGTPDRLPSAAYAARAAVALATYDGAQAWKAREIVLKALAADPSAMQDSLVGVIPTLRLLAQHGLKRESLSRECGLTVESLQKLSRGLMDVLREHMDDLLPAEAFALVVPLDTAALENPLYSRSATVAADVGAGYSPCGLLASQPWISNEDRADLQERLLRHIATKHLRSIPTGGLIEVLCAIDLRQLLAADQPTVALFTRELISRSTELCIPRSLRGTLRLFLVQRQLNVPVPKLTEVLTVCILRCAAVAEQSVASLRQREANDLSTRAELVLSLDEVHAVADAVEDHNTLNDLLPAALARHLILQVPNKENDGNALYSPGHGRCPNFFGWAGKRGKPGAAAALFRQNRTSAVGEENCGGQPPLRESAEALGRASWLRAASRVLFQAVDTDTCFPEFSDTVMQQLTEAVRHVRSQCTKGNSQAAGRMPPGCRESDRGTQGRHPLCLPDSSRIRSDTALNPSTQPHVGGSEDTSASALRFPSDASDDSRPARVETAVPSLTRGPELAAASANSSRSSLPLPGPQRLNPRFDQWASLSADHVVELLWSLCFLHYHQVDDNFATCADELVRAAFVLRDAAARQLKRGRSALLLRHVAERLEAELPTTGGMRDLSDKTRELLRHTAQSKTGANGCVSEESRLQPIPGELSCPQELGVRVAKQNRPFQTVQPDILVAASDDHRRFLNCYSGTEYFSSVKECSVGYPNPAAASCGNNDTAHASLWKSTTKKRQSFKVVEHLLTGGV